ncbi:glycosyltransferase [Vibrio splendidus]|uniref:Glycosyltransferase n=1 Tax=Vibrio splendidus TaxID=29497 RepID=A0ABD5AGW7_VIBSP|nr:glycosyltransferase [Vibrio splendidus]MDP2492202.1 glycosyltransferase [Vibrio splendidus]PMO50577.1 hypothetical protein BCT08_23545 [Vibrio splendidus]
MPKILLVIDVIDKGGAEKVLTKLGERLCKDNKVVITSIKPPTKEGCRLLEKHGLDYTTSGINTFGIVGQIRFTFFLSKLIKFRKIEHVISFLERSNVASVMAVKLSNENVKISCNVRNVLSQQYKKIPNPLINYLLRRFVGFFYNKANHIITNSNGIKYDLNSKFFVNNDIISVVFNTYNFKDKCSNSGTTQLDSLVKDDKVVYFGGMGRFEAQKDFFTLIKTYAKFLDDYDIESKLVLAGDGPLLYQLKSLVNDLNLDERVIFVGYVNPSQKFFDLIDCFILSSRFEGFPNVLAESLIYCPLSISVDCMSGPREILSALSYTDYTSKIDEITYFDLGCLVPLSSECEVNEQLAIAMYNTILNKSDSMKNKDISFLNDKGFEKKWSKALEIKI